MLSAFALIYRHPICHQLARIGACWLVLVLTACEQAAINPPAPTTITLAGATAMQPVLHDLTAEFSRQHPNVLFNWLGGSSTTGEELLRAQQIDLAASTLDPAANVSVAVAAQAAAP